MIIGQTLYSEEHGKLTVAKKAYSAVKNAVVWYGVDEKGREHVLDGTETENAPAKEVKVSDMDKIVKAIRVKKGEKGDKGDKGDIGFRGEKGEKGDKGDKGDKGEPGNDGEDGKDGKDGKQGIQGVKGEAGKDGKDGKNGKKGDKGEPGLNGLSGGGGIHEIKHATDVDYSPRTATNGQALVWNSETKKWEPGTVAGGSGSGIVETIVAGNNIDVDATDPANPIVSVETLTLADISDVTASVTEINYVDGVTSAIQTQLDAKLDDSQATAFGLSLLDDANAAAGRTTLGLGTAAVVATDLADLNEATIEGAIDTLANLTSIQGRTITLADAGADALLGWDDSASAYQNLSAADAKTALSLAKGDVGLGNVDNTSDANKPVSTATQTALDLKAPLASPTFSGTVTLPVGLTGVLRADTGVVSADSDVTDLVSAASTILAGKVELATDAETNTGTDTTRAITPANLTAWTGDTNIATVGTITAGTWNGTDIAVADGGTGRSTSTTAYGLIAAGTTATGAHQTLAAGATTEILVGGGASALPVWTTAQGSGAPVRATSPTLTTPNIGTPSAGVLTNCTGLPAASVVPGTLAAGTYLLAENASIGLDPAGSADGKYSGITVTGTGGATIAFGDLVTLDKDDSRWELVDISVAAAATGDARGIIGIAVTSSTDGGAITVLLNGIIRADANFPALTIGAPVYASTTGDVVVTQPTTTNHVIRIVGYGLTADEMYFNPGAVWTTHT